MSSDSNPVHDPDLLTSHLLEQEFKDLWKLGWSQDEKTVDLFQKGIEFLLTSLEGLSESQIKKTYEAWQEIPYIFEWAVDWWSCKDAIQRIRAIRDRFFSLRPAITGRVPDTEVNSYLREATRCYLYGFSQASIALSRAAMEVGLNKHLEKALSAVPSLKLNEKIRQAEQWKLLSGAMCEFARDVSKAAGRVLHQRPAPEKLAFNTLIRARAVLMELYTK